jgi:hypothetical protein
MVWNLYRVIDDVNVLADVQVRHNNQLMQSVVASRDRHAKLDRVTCDFKGQCVIFVNDLPVSFKFESRNFAFTISNHFCTALLCKMRDCYSAYTILYFMIDLSEADDCFLLCVSQGLQCHYTTDILLTPNPAM